MTVQQQFKKALKALKKTIRASNATYRVTSSKRTTEKQAELYADPSNPYPVAKPGRSQHEYGLAEDLVVNPRELQAWAGNLWREAGYGWSEQDAVHFSYFTAAEWSQLLGLAEAAPSHGFQYAGGFSSPFAPIQTPAPVGQAPSQSLQTSYFRAPVESSAAQSSVASIAARAPISEAITPTPTTSTSSIAVRLPEAVVPVGSRDYTAPGTSSITRSTYVSR